LEELVMVVMVVGGEGYCYEVEGVVDDEECCCAVVVEVGCRSVDAASD
jgi:hypothetical protein